MSEAVAVVGTRRKKPFLARHVRLLISYGALAVLIIVYRLFAPYAFSSFVITSTLNQGMALAISGMAQTLVILTAGIDLSIGSIVTLSNTIAASQMQQAVPPTLGVLVGCLLVGAAAGALNGVLVAYGRLAPIIVTLATSSIFNGIALYVLPNPGGSVPEWYSNLLTGRLLHAVPASLFLLFLILGLFWYPLKSSALGQAIYAVGSSETSARMSGLNVARTKLLTYTLAGLLAALAGLFVTANTATGDATQGGTYTLNSIAATVIGGNSFFGGVGGAGGTIAGAYVLSVIPSVLFAARVSPFMTELLRGAILVLVISLSSVNILRMKSHVEALRQ